MNQQRARRFRTALDADVARCIKLAIPHFGNRFAKLLFSIR